MGLLIPAGVEGAEPGRAAARASGVAPRLHERAFDILASQIVSGALRPGERLLESRVAEKFGISRAPARQALARLEQLGLVRRAEGHGFLVELPIGPVPSVPDQAPAGDIHLAPESTCERIYKEVEHEVVTRSAFGAFRVVENHLAAAYGVSRTVAREALSRLHQRGVVRKDARLHWYAPALTPAYVAELFEMRAILEPAALRLAAPRLPPAILAALRGNLAQAMADPYAVDGARLSALEEELHISLLGHCGNATLMDALSTYQTLLVALTFLYDAAARAPGMEPFLAEHLDVAERLSAGHADAAVEALKNHLDGSFARAMERLERVRQMPAPGPLPYLSPL
ncbi:GntR family transcriptional regulator [Xanthobacter autotrophicus]|uniref:GntR family transcriptional regulator n=1 Tax=Xanthobacter TaxID=279 RepID=UPI0024AB449D|nr:GntR family transcriptional regulator [Xanthobacter autotrophicus]MDI4663907.1 GntR family transcriptional regulator [Xanthobacter autotrophicus]